MNTATLTQFVEEELRKAANPEKAPQMAAYMKHKGDFLGVQRPGRKPIEREIGKRWKPSSPAEYREGILALWQMPWREAQYVAIVWAARHRKFRDHTQIDLYEQMIREGAWWDLVDGVVGDLLSPVYKAHREDIRPVVEKWLDDEDMWVRRAAIISQLKHKDETDEEQLFRFCLARAHEKEFFIRKAIGWALRDYSYAAPDSVKQFLLENEEFLSGLSFREGAKVLKRKGLW